MWNTTVLVPGRSIQRCLTTSVCVVRSVAASSQLKHSEAAEADASGASVPAAAVEAPAAVSLSM